MSELFSEEWMEAFQEGWNNEPGIKDALAEIGFESVIGYGFKGDDQATGLVVIENGECTGAGTYEGGELDWDIRADKKSWLKWQSKGIGMAGLGMAYASGKMKFVSGDYGSMAKNPKMAGPFIKSFGIMKAIETS